MKDLFKEKFKYYKNNKTNQCMDGVLSVNRHCNMVVQLPSSDAKDDRVHILGLQKPDMWELYRFVQHPGLFFIRNPFTCAGQRYWIRRCLEEYPKKPNKLNIDIEMTLEDWWMTCHENGKCNKQLQKKLRWTTLGYHHNWDTKVYSDENRNTFPEDLAELSDVVACYLGYSNYKAEAAIVNYYHMDSTLFPHTDHSEVNLDAPLLSFSFGQSAIFLIGDKDKCNEPSAILLNSGDIVVMSKEARLCYHAVPKILPATSSPWCGQDDVNESEYNKAGLKYISNRNQVTSLMNNSGNTEWSRFETYINESRINMNVRQVLNDNQTVLPDFINDR